MTPDQETIERPYRIAAELTRERVMLAERRAAYENRETIARRRAIERKARRDVWGIVLFVGMFALAWAAWTAGYGRWIAALLVAGIVVYLWRGVRRYLRGRAARGTEVL